jgi:hypothetical protein
MTNCKKLKIMEQALFNSHQRQRSLNPIPFQINDRCIPVKGSTLMLISDEFYHKPNFMGYNINPCPWLRVKTETANSSHQD